MLSGHGWSRKSLHWYRKRRPILVKWICETHQPERGWPLSTGRKSFRMSRCSHPNEPQTSTTSFSAVWTSRCPERQPGGEASRKKLWSVLLSLWNAKASRRSQTWWIIWTITGSLPTRVSAEAFACLMCIWTSLICCWNRVGKIINVYIESSL